jgi:hypothetical protein
MPTIFEKIATVEVGSGGASTIDFTSIPSTFTDLYILVSSRSSHTSVLDELILRFNSSATGYANRFVMGDGSATQSYANNYTTSGYVGYISAASSTSSTFGSSNVYIPNYAGSQNKPFSSDSVAETNATTQYMNLNTTIWSNTAAITSVQLRLGYANFVQYSTATLYGIKKA